MIRPYLSEIINDHKTQGEWRVHSGNTVNDYKTQGEWKIQLTMVINLISSKDSDEIRIMRAKSNNTEIIMGNETDKIIKDLFESLFQKYQEVSEESIRRVSNFVFDSGDLLYYHLQKTSLKRIGLSYIDSPEWLKNKKPTVNPNNDDDNCFQYSLTVPLNYQNIKKPLKEYQTLNPLLINMIGKK